ncbi:dioxygenase family protein [Propionibacterium cyclohexanicum]|nr:class III extradiol ring-cleavage dioxygenase [Propionibacterium cyclohexanicum]
MTELQPVVFLSHGAPPLADDRLWTSELSQWGTDLPRPKAILVISAHWDEKPITLGASEQRVPLTYDFWGFPQHYYTVRYDAPLAPELAARVEQLLGGQVHRDEQRGLDHGAYVPLKEMFPQADVPVLQMSMPGVDPRTLFAVGRKLAPLRQEGVLILGSGFTTHNLKWIDGQQGAEQTPRAESSEFDQWADEAMRRHDVDTLLDYAAKAPAANQAHSWPDHWAPLFITLGVADASGSLDNRTVIDGFWFGLSKRSWQFS